MYGFAYGGVMPLCAILIREYFGARIMGTTFGAVAFVSTLGMALGPWAGGWLYDAFGSYFWLFIGSFGIGPGAVAIAFTFPPPPQPPAGVPTPLVVHRVARDIAPSGKDGRRWNRSSRTPSTPPGGAWPAWARPGQ